MIEAKNISIALATYNGSKYISHLLSSLEKQTMPPSRLIIVDDCSTDNTWEIINSFCPARFKVERYRNKKNLGITKTFKKLVSLCGNDYIAFCDQDDIWMPKKLETCYMSLLAIDDNTAPAVVFSDLSLIDSKGDLLNNSFWKVYKININKTKLKNILFGNIITGCTTLINTPMSREILQMPDNAIMYDYWIALIAYTFGKSYGIHEPQVFYRSHTESATVKKKKNIFLRVLDNTGTGESYLKAEIMQAKLFRSLYSVRLAKEALGILEEFIALEHKPFLFKKIKRLIVNRSMINFATNRNQT